MFGCFRKVVFGGNNQTWVEITKLEETPPNLGFFHQSLVEKTQQLPMSFYHISQNALK